MDQPVKPKGLLRVRLPWAKPRVKASAPWRPAVQSFLNARPLVIGHRGYSSFAPENTLAAFRLALQAGVDLVELDYRQTADGQLIVLHDADLDRTTDARLRWGGKNIAAETKTTAEIRSLDAGSWFDAKYAGARVPLLTEALDLIHPRAVVLLERKSGDVESTAQLLESRRL